MVQLPPQSRTHKTLGVMIYTKDVSGKLALPQFRSFFATEKGQTDTKGLQSGFFYLIHYNLLKRILLRLRKTLEIFWWLEFLDWVVWGHDGMVTDKKESTHLVSPRM